MATQPELFSCPVCGRPLHFTQKTCACANGHSYDRASEDYVNLLTPAHGVHTGDDPGMVRARRDFLARGYYRPLADALCAAVPPLLGPGDVLLDAGCGEGYYTVQVAQSLCSGAYAAGLDISKTAVRLAAKRCKTAQFAVAGIFHMPVLSGAAACVTSVFAPYSAEEFQRVVKPGGYVLAVVPGRRHLYGMKEIVYETPYENDEAGYDLPGFTPVDRREVSYEKSIEGPDVMNLFAMTPYFWKSPAEGVKRLRARQTLETELSFLLLLYKKTGGH